MQDARDLADYILLRAAANGRYLTPLHVNKLCYLTHGFMLRNTGHGAFHNKVEVTIHPLSFFFDKNKKK